MCFVLDSVLFLCVDLMALGHQIATYQPIKSRYTHTALPVSLNWWQ